MPHRVQITSVILTTLLVMAAGGDVIAQPGSLAKSMANSEAVSACRVGMRPFESERGKILLGEVIAQDFPRLLPDWDHEMAAYEPDPAALEFLAGIEEEVEIICVLGTWCHDSEREVPRFWKVLQMASNPNLELFMFAVGRSGDQQARQVMVEIGFDESLRQQYNVELVPTFIFFRNGEEVGRIIETPDTTLEIDTVDILALDQPGPVQPTWN